MSPKDTCRRRISGMTCCRCIYVRHDDNWNHKYSSPKRRRESKKKKTDTLCGCVRVRPTPTTSSTLNIARVCLSMVHHPWIWIQRAEERDQVVGVSQLRVLRRRCGQNGAFTYSWWHGKEDFEEPSITYCRELRRSGWNQCCLQARTESIGKETNLSFTTATR